MSRGPGTLQRRVLGLLLDAEDGLTLPELRGALYGWRRAASGGLIPGLAGRWLPAATDDRSLRRALSGLQARGNVIAERGRGLGWRGARIRYRAVEEPK